MGGGRGGFHFFFSHLFPYLQRVVCLDRVLLSNGVTTVREQVMHYGLSEDREERGISQSESEIRQKENMMSHRLICEFVYIQIINDLLQSLSIDLQKQKITVEGLGLHILLRSKTEKDIQLGLPTSMKKKHAVTL